MATTRTRLAWELEYASPRIPSSYVDSPSSSLCWALANLGFLGIDAGKSHALDLGCGTGRNTWYLAERGFDAVGVDLSAQALSVATRAASTADPDITPPQFARVDIVSGLPFAAGAFAFVTDNFVYFHQIDRDERSRYRRSVRRVLAPAGLLLVVLATDQDGYYAGCPRVPGRASDDVPAVTDPVVGIANLLFTENVFLDEMTDQFTLQILWRKRSRGVMHGKEYTRCSIATLWRPRTGY